MMLLLTTLLACQDDEPVTLDPEHFDGPSGVAVLDPRDGGPYAKVVGFVSSSRSGRVHAFDAELGWLLSDHSASPFLPAEGIGLGARRQLGDLAVIAGDDTVDLFVADAFTATLVEAPYITGVNAGGEPQGVQPVFVAQAFTDTDGSGDSASLDGVHLQPSAASETWTLVLVDGEWQVEGSRSGPQAEPAVPLLPYSTDDGAVAFTVFGTATDGDELAFSVDGGVFEHDLGGTIQALHHLHGAGLLLASVYDLTTELGALEVFDLDTRTRVGAVALPAGAVPYRMATDASESRLFVTDTRADVIYDLALAGIDPTAWTVDELATPGPVADLAWQGDGTYEHLFVGLSALNRLDVYDLNALEWLDVNAVTPGVDGVQLDSPIVGMTPSVGPLLLPHTTAWGGVTEDRVVGVATFAGDLWVAEGATGCLARDATGPYSLATGSLSKDAGATSNAFMDDSGATGRPIQVNPCGGVVRSEQWLVTYVESAGHWLVEGALSGPQEAVAYEDERYVSDTGAVSFLIRSGTLASSDGDQFDFETVEGLVVADGDVTGDGVRDIALELPGRPVAYELPDPDAETGWEAQLLDQQVAWPIINSDTLLKVDLATGALDALIE